MPLPVTVLAGLHSDVQRRVAEELTASAARRCALVTVEVGGGSARRTVRTGDDLVCTDEVAVDDSCSCAVAAATAPLLVSLALREEYAAAVLCLPATIEPEACAVELIRGEASGEVLRISAVVTAVDPDQLVEDLSGDDLLADRGTALDADDRRAVAEVLVRQIEYANVLVTASGGGPGAALLGHLNPQAEVVDVTEVAALGLPHARRYDPATAAGWAERGCVSAPLTESCGGVTTVYWQARRPFHPQRLFDALPTVIAGVARSRGSLWLASRPAERQCWESAGKTLAMGSLGPWLADRPAGEWHLLGPSYRAQAALEWDPKLGDRRTSLVFTGVGLDPSRLRALLDGCLVGPDGWTADPADDPFTPYLESTS